MAEGHRSPGHKPTRLGCGLTNAYHQFSTRPQSLPEVECAGEACNFRTRLYSMEHIFLIGCVNLSSTQQPLIKDGLARQGK